MDRAPVHSTREISNELTKLFQGGRLGFENINFAFTISLSNSFGFLFLGQIKIKGIFGTVAVNTVEELLQLL